MSIGEKVTTQLDEATSDQRRDPLLVAAIVRAFDVIDYLVDASSPPTLGEIAKKSGLTFQAVQRVTNAMMESGYVDRDERHKTYRFSQRTLDLQYTYLRTNNLLKAAWPILMTLREQTRLRVSLCVLDGTDIVYLLRLASDPRDFQTLLIGRRRTAALTAGGQAILAALPPEERESLVHASDLVALTARSITDPAAILARLEVCAADEYCIEEQEIRSGEISAAVALAPAAGKASHAIVVAGLSETHSAESLRREVIPLLQNAAIALDRA